MPVQVRPDGPIPAKIMVVGEAPGADEERVGTPFVGASGHELDRMLHEAGISRSECFVTNVARERPFNNDIGNFIAKSKKERSHEHMELRDKFVKRPIIDGYRLLLSEISMVKPNIIVALGNVSLWALTGIWGITKWRGSMLHTDTDPKVKLIPTLHPAAILRQWSDRAIAVNDLKRAARFRSGLPYPDPRWNFIIRPTISQVISILTDLIAAADVGPRTISFDLETKCGHIDCAGVAWSIREALCIPFWDDYWGENEEAEIVHHLYRLLTHPNAEVIGQNLLYDSQYTYRHWHFIPRVTQDTMISWHVAFAGLPKRLDFQASMLCDQYKQWKPDRTAWKTGG